MLKKLSRSHIFNAAVLAFALFIGLIFATSFIAWGSPVPSIIFALIRFISVFSFPVLIGLSYAYKEDFGKCILENFFDKDE